MILGKFELNEYLRNELDILGYKNVGIWNILTQLRDEMLPKKIQKQVQKLETELQEFKKKNPNIGRYTREYKKIQDLTIQISDLKHENYSNKLVEPLEIALDNLHYSSSIEIKNECMKVAINFIKEIKIKEV